MQVAMGRGGWLLCALIFLGAAAVGSPTVASGAEEPPIYLSSFGPEGPGNSNFQSAGTAGVDQESGQVYVLDVEAHALYKFDSHGQPVAFGGSSPGIAGNELSGLSFYPYPAASQVAVNGQTHTFYLTQEHSLRAFQADGEAAEFTAGPGTGTAELPGFGELYGVAVAGNGDIYTSDHAGSVKIFSPSGEPITEFAAPEAGNIAVASDGSVYVNRFFGTVLKYTPNENPVTSTTTFSPAAEPVDPKETIGVGVDPVSGRVFLMQRAGVGHRHIVVYSETGAFLETLGDPGEAGELLSEANGVAVWGTAGRIYAATDDGFSSFSQVRIFGPEEVFPGVATIRGVHVSAVDASTGILHAEVNPNTFDTSYRFEYGLDDCAVSTCTAVPLGGEDIGSGYKAISVQQAISGLQPDSTYHYRVVASNDEGVTQSQDSTFRTEPWGGGSQLSDSRVWEMVSPPDKHGGFLVGSELGTIQAAEDGQGLAYLSVGSIEAEPEGSRPFETSQVMARREATGWRSKDIDLPNTDVISATEGRQNVYKAFTPSLSRAVIEPRSSTVLSSEASERTPYLRENSLPPTYTPLVTGKEGYANVPPGTEFGRTDSAALKVRFAGATPDLDHVILKSEVPLAENGPEVGISLYEWTAGAQLQPVSVLPGGEIVAAEMIGSGQGTVQNAISEDASRVFWSLGSHQTPLALYLRDMETAQTVRLDVPKGGTGDGQPDPVFQGASRDGTVVYFTDSQQLTDNASKGGHDLYRCEIPPGESAAGCATLSDISAPLDGSTENSNVQGLVSGLGEDGGTVYFVANGVLDEAPNGSGAKAQRSEPGLVRPNLYRWREGEFPRFIASLSPEDRNDWGGTDGGETAKLSTGISPDGRYLAFMSQRSLSGYDTRDARTGEPVQEVYLYDAAEDNLECISCKPTGASPEGEVRIAGANFVDPQLLWGGQAVAAMLPQAPVDENRGTSFYRPRVVLNDGRTFFNAVDALVPADSNGKTDVYQYEPSGVGSCGDTSDGPTTMRSAGGCVSLTSSGTADEEAAFLDASASGDDVFFLSTAKLSQLDRDTAYDVYDARVNGVVATLPTVAECLGEACQPPVQPPNDATPASAAFKGAGNLKPASPRRCGKGKHAVRHKGKRRCVAKHHRHRHRNARSSAGGQQ